MTRPVKMMLVAMATIFAMSCAARAGSGSRGVVASSGTSKPTTIAVGNTPMSVLYAAGAIWVANRDGGTVSRIDPLSNQLVATIHVGGTPFGLAFGAGSVWVGNDVDGPVTRIDPGSDRVVARVRAGSVPLALAFGFDALWAADYGVPRLFKVDPTKNRVVAAFPVAGSHLAVLPLAGRIWMTSEQGNIVAVNHNSGRVTKDFKGGSDPTFLKACNGSLWVSNFQGDRLWEINPRTARLQHRLKIDFGLAGIACVARTLWIAEYYLNRIIVVNPRGRVLRSVRTGDRPTDVVLGAGSVWVTNSTSNTVTRIPVS